jgi:hypothetical protein
VEDSLVSLFPDCLYGESWEQLLDALENWIMEGDRLPVGDRVLDASSVSVGVFHGLGLPIPDLLTIVAVVAEMFHGFLALLT